MPPGTLGLQIMWETKNRPCTTDKFVLQPLSLSKVLQQKVLLEGVLDRV